jgi:DNA-binding CsgD family transcriptional regulator
MRIGRHYDQKYPRKVIMKRVSLVLNLAVTAGLSLQTASAQTLKTVKDRGMLSCGVGQGLPGFSSPDDNGNWSGLDVDVCRAIAAAIFNDASKVKFVPLSAKDRFTALQSGEIDVLSRNTTWTLSRDTSLGIKGIAIPLTGKSGERYVGHVLPLTSGARRKAGVAYTAAAALFIRKAALVTSSRPEVISKAFNLTPMELRVLLAIVEVGGVPRVAAALGVADTTIKTHLGRLFEKTGAKRQADLVKLVAGYATPLTS